MARKIKPASTSNPRYEKYSARVKIRARVLREESHCWLCGAPVDTSLPHGMPESPEVDEVVPISKGGSPIDRNNVRLAHRLCNQKRGNKDIGDYRVERMKPLKTSRQWR